jgi:hypothetical protein
LPAGHFARSVLAATIVMLGLAGCGRTELFGSRRRCAPTDTVCQMQIADGGAGVGGIAGSGGHAGSSAGSGGIAGSGGFGGRDGGAGSGGLGGRDGGAGSGGLGGRDGGPDGPVTCQAMLEICGNGKDDNCNGLVDCQDPLCMGDSKCTQPGKEVCNNNLDDNDNGKIDCADPECMGNISCKPQMGMETCDNGKDDNNDRLVDCADPQCTKFPACLQVVCSPDVDFGTIAAHGASVTRGLDTTGASESFTTCATPGGNGSVGRFVLTETVDVRMDVLQKPGAAHAVELFRAGANQACDRNPVRCVNAGDDQSTTETFAALPPGTYWLVVQSYPGTQGGVSITLSTGSTMTPEVCTNGKDDDGNGLIDCQDQACRAAANCQATECKPDGELGALVVGAPPKNVRLDLTQAPNRYKPLCAGNNPTGGDAAITFTLAEAGGIEVSYTQTGRTIFALYKQPEPGFTCDDGQAFLACSFEDQRSGAVAFSEQPPGKYVFIFKATDAGQEGVANLRISAFRNRRQEVCSNMIDDDGNGLTDCDDPTCFGVGPCGAPACKPDVDLGVIDIGTTRMTVLDTTTGTDLYHDCGKGNGKEKIVRFTLSQPMALGLDCTDSGSHTFKISQQLMPLDKCDEHDVSGCADPETLPFGCGFSFPNLQPGTYNMIVEAFQPGDEGKVSLSLTGIREIIREICDNGIDDDMDGATDCMDRKCVTSAVCERFACRPDKDLGLIALDGSVVQGVIQTTASSDDQTQTACVSAGGGQDGDFDFQLPARANVKLDWAQVGNHDFALYSDDGPVLSCEAGKSFACVQSLGAATGTTMFNNLPVGRYHLVIDADRAGAEGGVIVQISGQAAP